MSVSTRDTGSSQSGEPSYLYRLLEQNKVSPMQLEKRVVVASSISKFELDKFS